MELSIVVPTYNEAPNVAELVRRLTACLHGVDTEIIFVDDSTDDTPDTVREVAKSTTTPVRLIHRDQPHGGLGGAVVEGIHAARSDLCLVMDGDLQHPPEKIAEMLERFRRGGVDAVVASRYRGDGTAHGLADRSRVLVSRVSTLVTRAMFPIRLRDVTDPMTGFFLLDRRAIDIETLQPRGFKILLEILARTRLRVVEVPFDFGRRFAGDSKATLRQGLYFLGQLAALRFGKMSRFAAVGGLGAIINILMVWAFTHAGINYVLAAVIAAETTIIGNFLLIERVVFQDMRELASPSWLRFAKSFGFNNAETLIRVPLLVLLVDTSHVSSVIGTAITLAIAFVVRFVFHSLVVYAPHTSQASQPATQREELGAGFERKVG